jgi:alpha-mannosidase
VEPVVVCNPGPFPRTERVGDVAVEVPALGWAVVDLAAPAPALVDPPQVEARDGWVANGLLRVTWDVDGRLTSVWDVEHGREVLAPGAAGNVFHLHHDRPAEYDAWDVDRSYLDAFEELGGPVTIDVDVDTGTDRRGHQARIRFRRAFGASTLDQTLVVRSGSRRLDFVTEVDWHERHRFLKVAFPVDIRAEQATFEIQFGHVSRATHENTAFEQARFEVCAHRWADLSEAGYGVALLNDGKYGYDVRGNVLRLSLLRAPTAPDPECDQGHHRFTYALLPHAGDPGTGGVLQAATALNVAVAVVPTTPHPGSLPPSGSFVSVDDPGFVPVAVKRADDGSGDLVVRGYEAFGGHRRARLRVAAPFSHASRTDLLERPRHDLAVEGDSVLLSLRPFDLVTVRLSP